MNELMMGYHRAGGRPGSKEWWAKREGYYGFSKKRESSWKEFLFSVCILAGVGAGFVGILFWITG